MVLADFALPIGHPMMAGPVRVIWRWWARTGAKSSSPIRSRAPIPSQQGGWRWCDICQGLFYAGTAEKNGACPSDPNGETPHDGSRSLRYAIMYGEDSGGFTGRQTGWRWCQKCEGLFSSDDRSRGVCPADHGQHDASRSQLYVSALGDSGSHSGGTSLHYVMEPYPSIGLSRLWRTTVRCDGLAVIRPKFYTSCRVSRGSH